MNTTLYKWLALYLMNTLSAKDWLVVRQQAVCFDDLAGKAAPLDERGADLHLEWAQQDDCHIVPWYSEDYPALLAEIPDAPPFVFVKGQLASLSTPQIALVGSRRATQGGLNCAKHFAGQLSQTGLTITSGLALGIDTASHRGALNSGGTTIAVMASGIDGIYPRSNLALAEQVCAQGCLVTEMPIGTTVRPFLFPRRNRIISGLSLGTVVIEAAAQSGSLITARLAGEQGREVFAIPSAIQNRHATGCHHLIQQGAKLVTCIEDILQELPIITPQRRTTSSAESADESPLLQHVDYTATDFDTIVCRSKLTASEVSAMLTLLEINGAIQPCPGGYIRID